MRNLQQEIEFQAQISAIAAVLARIVLLTNTPETTTNTAGCRKSMSIGMNMEGNKYFKGKEKHS